MGCNQGTLFEMRKFGCNLSCERMSLLVLYSVSGFGFFSDVGIVLGIPQRLPTFLA